MKVTLYWKTKNTPEGKVHRLKDSTTVQKARQIYNERIKDIATHAWLAHFDGWHFKVYKTLKGKWK
jgi:hypothetical protein